MRIRLASGLCLLCCVGCGFIQTLTLGVDLLKAIADAPAGQKACAAFNVLNTEADGASLSGLLNFALAQTNSNVQFSAEQGDAVLRVVRTVNCEFISCFVEEIKSLDPPADDASVVEWVHAHIEVLTALATNCPSATNLTEDELAQLVRLVVDLKL